MRKIDYKQGMRLSIVKSYFGSNHPYSSSGIGVSEEPQRQGNSNYKVVVRLDNPLPGGPSEIEVDIKRLVAVEE